jgi:hypothetical protein
LLSPFFLLFFFGLPFSLGKGSKKEPHFPFRGQQKKKAPSPEKGPAPVFDRLRFYHSTNPVGRKVLCGITEPKYISTVMPKTFAALNGRARHADSACQTASSVCSVLNGEAAVCSFRTAKAAQSEQGEQTGFQRERTHFVPPAPPGLPSAHAVIERLFAFHGRSQSKTGPFMVNLSGASSSSPDKHNCKIYA